MADPVNQTAEATKDRVEWLETMLRICDIRDHLIFSRRRKFDEALRPLTQRGFPVAYPDAIYCVTRADVDRAEEIANA